MNEVYPSVRSEAHAHIKVEGSRFIAEIFPVTDEEDAKAKLASVRKKYFDATHHCFAYSIGAENPVIRYSDDGEPSGTAGIKIYTALNAKRLSDIMIVVTRYFGGVKLGAGGLGRAYFDAAESGLSHCEIIHKAAVKTVQIAFPFPETNPVMNIINTLHLRIARTEYSDEQTILLLHILPSMIPAVQVRINNATRGTARVTIGETATVVWQ